MQVVYVMFSSRFREKCIQQPHVAVCCHCSGQWTLPVLLWCHTPVSSVYSEWTFSDALSLLAKKRKMTPTSWFLRDTCGLIKRWITNADIHALAPALPFWIVSRTLTLVRNNTNKVRRHGLECSFVSTNIRRTPQTGILVCFIHHLKDTTDWIARLFVQNAYFTTRGRWVPSLLPGDVIKFLISQTPSGTRVWNTQSRASSAATDE